MTSMQELKGHAMPMADVKTKVIELFQKYFL
jgi:hypothetical protein